MVAVMAEEIEKTMVTIFQPGLATEEEIKKKVVAILQ